MAVFICYRREDSEGESRALYARLAEETDERNLFLDHDAIGAGDNWRARINETLAKAKVVLVIIGPAWADILARRTMDGAADTVSLEIAASLARPQVRVIPVTVKGAKLPPADVLPADLRLLTERNAIDIRGSAWRDDTARLVRTLRSAGALPQPRRRWLYRGLTAAAVVAIGGAVYASRVEVPAVPISMTKQYAQPLIENSGLRFKVRQVSSARFQGYVVEAAARGLDVAADQRPAPGQTVFRGQTVEVDFILREPYRLICKRGGELNRPPTDGTLRFEFHPGPWSLDMRPGTCAWTDGPLSVNQDPVLKPVGFLERLPDLFEKAPGGILMFCAYSEYDIPGGRSERLAALSYKQYLSPDDNGTLRPTVVGHVCDERL